MTETESLKAYKLIVKPPNENRINFRIYATSPSDAKEQALKRWPNSVVLVTAVKR